MEDKNAAELLIVERAFMVAGAGMQLTFYRCVHVLAAELLIVVNNVAKWHTNPSINTVCTQIATIL